MTAKHPSRNKHDLNQGYRDALALLTATHTEDQPARRFIASRMCWQCTIEALTAITLACIDAHYNSDVTRFVQNTMEGLNL